MDSGAQEALKNITRALGTQVQDLSPEAALIFLAIGEDQENGYSLSQTLGFAPVRIDLAFEELTQKELIEVYDTDLIPQMVALTERGISIRTVAAKAVE